MDIRAPVHALFEAQVARTPDAVAVAVAVEGTELSYAELNRRANQLARHLVALGVRPEVPVALVLERSLDLVVGILGVLKAGGAWVPLDPAYPLARLTFMLERARPRVVLTQRRLVERLPALDVTTICLDSDWSEFARGSMEALAVDVSPDNLAYVIFTSGSTGYPKGTLLTHRGLRNTVLAVIEAHDIRRESRVLQFASAGFDASVCEVLSTLLAGACLVLAPRELLLPGPPLHALLREQAITAVTLVPSALAQLEPEGLPALETVISAGEACPPELVRRWKPGRRFLNAYGPTEATICATLDTDVDPGRPSIGLPLPDVQAHVLDERLAPVPDGEPGELYVGGVGLARGYLGHPELTAERFIPAATGSAPGARLYRTGDRVRRMPDGRLEFLGRVDQQVKLRGFRIELGEVEAVLARHPGIRQAAVLLREDVPGHPRLVAYLTTAGATRPKGGELAAFLQERLPEHMVPSAFVMLEEFPRTPHGKLDRQALPAPRHDEAEHVAPRTPLEARLAELWASLLGLERVGLHDDFFALGGHSLLAGRLIARVREALHVELSLSGVFGHPTVARLAAHLARRVEAEPAEEARTLPPIPVASRDGPLPLTFPQEQVWFLSELAPDNIAYNAQMLLRLEGRLDPAVLERALGEVVRRHESLRTTFPAQDGRPVQRIHPPWAVSLPVVDLSGAPDPEAAARRRVAEEVQGRFDTSRLPLVRWTLLRLGPVKHVLLHVEHHFIHDGWSAAVFLRELMTLYRAFAAGAPSPLPALRVQLADFATWQRRWLQGSVLEAQLDYWKRRLGDLPPPLELPADRPRPRVHGFRGGELRTELPEPLRRALKALCRRQGTTFFMALQAAFLALLHRYTGQEDVCIATTVANRRSRDVESLIGMLVNTVLLRTDLSGEPSFRELLRRVRAVNLEAYAHQDVPLMALVMALQPDRDPGRQPLFQVMFSFHDSPVPELDFGGGLRGTAVPIGNGSAKCDLNVVVIPLGEQRVGSGAPEDGPVSIRWEYSADLFDHETVVRLAARYQLLLEAVAADAETRLPALPLLAAEERHRLLVEWNDTRSGPPPEPGLHSFFEAQARRTPDAVAVVVEGRGGVTYRELDRRASQLARYLVRLGVGPEVRVGLCVERSVEMVAGLLGILKAGGAYVPLDPGYPPERLGFMLRDAGMAVLVTQRALLPRLPSGAARPVCLDAEAEAIAREDEAPFGREALPGAAAYVLYTSGSTGTPKGVVVSHGAAANFLASMREEPGLSARDVLVAVTTLSFDIALLELFLPLSVGAVLVVASREVAGDGARLGALLEGCGATVMQATPTTWRLLLESGWTGRRLKALCGGEALPRELAGALQARCGAVWNLYGPTETTVWSTVHPVSAREGPVPIGRPIASTQVYLLDRWLQPVPPGVPGELYIGGAGVARGYLGRPELTAERFVPDPFRGVPGGRLYRTGDVGRHRADGSLELLGRADQQVKLRGYRIELEEIEAVLGRAPGVAAAVVVVREDVPGDRRLVAYVVPAGGQAPVPEALRALLRSSLPDYMVPSRFVVLRELPRTPGGKVDRRALPPPGEIDLGSAHAFVAPRTPDEELLARIWSALLGVARVGVQDDFFVLGGHSLLAAQLVARVRAELGAELTVRDVFDAPTVAGLAGTLAVARERPAGVDEIRRVELPADPEQLSDDEVNVLLGLGTPQADS